MATTILFLLGSCCSATGTQPTVMAPAALRWWENKFPRENKFEPSGLGLDGPETLVTLFAQSLQNTVLTWNTKLLPREEAWEESE